MTSAPFFGPHLITPSPSWASSQPDWTYSVGPFFGIKGRSPGGATPPWTPRALASWDSFNGEGGGHLSATLRPEPLRYFLLHQSLDAVVGFLGGSDESKVEEFGFKELI
uniref:Uncharacterized protein n=1 Tax=Steinernema glaseri TaxID=37863 RepID=A0A1I7XXN3_9BILA